MGEVEKNSFIALSDKGGHRGNALKTVSPPGGGSEEFYSHGSKRRLVRQMVVHVQTTDNKSRGQVGRSEVVVTLPSEKQESKFIRK